MRTTLRLAALGIVGLGLATTGCSREKGETLAKVGEDRITVEEFESSLKALPPQWKARAKTPSGRKQILEHQIRQKLIQLEAEDRGIDEQPDVKYQIDQALQRILLQELMKAWQDEFEIPENELRAHYEKNQDEFAAAAKFRAQHILVKVSSNAKDAEVKKAKAKADKLRQRVLAGESFEDLANQESEGPSAEKGGDLGYVEKGRFHPKFEEAAMALKPGEISDPVRTPFGWHIIKLVDIQEAEQKSFEDARDEIRKQLMPRKRQEAFETYMEQLRTKYTVEIDDDKLMASAGNAGKADDAAAEPEAQ